MELIIDIPEEEYERMKEQSMFGRVDVWKRAIKNGKPLPEHHGRLIDADALTEKAPEIQEYLDVLAPTIIEGSDNE